MPAAGDSACVQTAYLGGIVKKLTFAVTFDSGDGSFTAKALTTRIDGTLLRLVTNPGSTKPTDNYDVTIIDHNGVDVLQGAGMNRDDTNSEQAAIVFSGTNSFPVVAPSDVLTLTITGNSVNSATTLIELYWIQG